MTKKKKKSFCVPLDEETEQYANELMTVYDRRSVGDLCWFLIRHTAKNFLAEKLPIGINQSKPRAVPVRTIGSGVKRTTPTPAA